VLVACMHDVGVCVETGRGWPGTKPVHGDGGEMVQREWNLPLLPICLGSWEAFSPHRCDATRSPQQQFTKYGRLMLSKGFEDPLPALG